MVCLEFHGFGSENRKKRTAATITDLFTKFDQTLLNSLKNICDLLN